MAVFQDLLARGRNVVFIILLLALVVAALAACRLFHVYGTAEPMPLAVLSAIGLAALALGAAAMMATRRQASTRVRNALVDRDRAESALAQKERKYRSVIQASAEGYWMIDPHTHRTVEVNRALCELLGYEPEEMIGRPPTDFVDPRNTPDFDHQLLQIPTTEHRVYEMTLRRKDGRNVITRFSASTLRDEAGAPLAAFAFVTDITAQRLHDNEIGRLQDRLRQIVEMAGEGICGLDGLGHVVFANRALCALAQRSEDQMVGRAWADLLSFPALSPPALSPIDAALAGTPHRADGSLRGASALVPVDCVATPLDDRDHRGGAVVVVRDISERIEREEMYREMFERSPAVKLLISPDGRMVDANAAAEAFYGYPAGTMRGMPLADLDVRPTTQVSADLDAAIAGRTRFFAATHRRKDGSLLDVELHIGPVRVSGQPHLHAVVADMTQRNRFEADLEAASRDLQRSNAELEAFAYVASHDLRQPLRMVTSFLTLLERRLGGSLTPDCAEYLNFARDGAHQMDELILALLDYSRVGRAEHPFEAVSMEQVVDYALANLTTVIEDNLAQVTVKAAVPPLLGDRIELVRLIQNLVGNAIKYRHPARQPAVTIEAQAQDGECLVTVRDNGIGIAPEYHDRIFRIFQRLHTQEQVEGTGIGLALCKKIAEHHQGRIWMDSTPGEGSAFHVALPLAQQS